MSERISDDVMVDHLFGRLNREDSEAFERQLKLHPALRRRYFELQEGMEERVRALGASEVLSAGDFERAKERLFQTLNLKLTEAVEVEGFEKEQDDTLTEFRKKPSEPHSRWLAVSAWAVAAVVVMTLIPLGLLRFIGSENGGSGPALVVYDILDGSNINLDSIASGENIREVLYINRDGHDRLSRAESYAEQLWDEYLQNKEQNPDLIRGRGFVVLDLEGQQGFAGFYDAPSGDESSSPVHEVLWLANSIAEPQVPMGPTSGEPGVFYFTLEAGKMEISTLNQFIPITKVEENKDV